ncbi:hypothetical protein CYMTET_36535, partial [Cymbomonas tetramitiformis]
IAKRCVDVTCCLQSKGYGISPLKLSMEDDVTIPRTSNVGSLHVRFGDEVLLAISDPWLPNGFMCSTTDFQSCVVHCQDSDINVPHSLLYTRFFIYHKMQYNALKEFSLSSSVSE